VLGRDIHWWFDKLHLNGTNLFSDHGVPVIDSGRYRSALRRAKPPTKPMFKAFFKDGVIWSDDTEEVIDTVIFATGFRPAMPFLSGIGALDNEGFPMHRNGISTIVAGLGYVGLSGQNGFASATLRGVGRDAGVVIPRLLMQS
jgi:putative flavoprotein involved in K+ transport